MARRDGERDGVAAGHEVHDGVPVHDAGTKRRMVGRSFDVLPQESSLEMLAQWDGFKRKGKGGGSLEHELERGFHV